MTVLELFLIFAGGYITCLVKYNMKIWGDEK